MLNVTILPTASAEGDAACHTLCLRQVIITHLSAAGGEDACVAATQAVEDDVALRHHRVVEAREDAAGAVLRPVMATSRHVQCVVCQLRRRHTHFPAAWQACRWY